MNILVEGPDGSGKTTLCKQLCELGIPIVTMSRTCKLSKHLYKTTAYAITVAYDRSFITDLVYRLLDGEKRQDMDLSEMIESLKNTVIVYCTSDTAYIDSMERGEDNITNAEDAERIRDLYDIVINLFETFCDIKIFDYNWKADTAENLYKKIMDEGGNKNAI